jgi:hypothetical protein
LGSLLKYFGCRIRVAHFSNWYFWAGTILENCISSDFPK